MKKVPKQIIDKCNQLEKTLDKANSLRVEIEAWCLKNGLDIVGLYSEDKDLYYTIVNDCMGCGFSLSAEGIQMYFDNM